jgi:hypothetical protein
LNAHKERKSFTGLTGFSGLTGSKKDTTYFNEKTVRSEQEKY